VRVSVGVVALGVGRPNPQSVASAQNDKNNPIFPPGALAGCRADACVGTLGSLAVLYLQCIVPSASIVRELQGVPLIRRRQRLPSDCAHCDLTRDLTGERMRHA
jgi:hypothetical protein